MTASMHATITAVTSLEYQLKDDQVDIWEYSLEGDINQVFALLDADEQQRCQRFYFEHHQRRFAYAHAVLRVILARYLNCSPWDLTFSNGAHGKPELINSNGLYFNLSHSQDRALLAVGFKNNLGIDLEYFSGRSFLGIARQVFSPLELASLQKTPDYAQALAFFSVWSQKEALIKANGMGLSFPMNTVDVPLRPHQGIEVYDVIAEQNWQIHAFMPAPVCSAALCCTTLIKNVYYRSINKANCFE